MQALQLQSFNIARDVNALKENNVEGSIAVVLRNSNIPFLHSPVTCVDPALNRYSLECIHCKSYCRSQSCNCKKGSDWLKRWVAQHNIFKL